MTAFGCARDTATGLVPQVDARVRPDLTAGNAHRVLRHEPIAVSRIAIAALLISTITHSLAAQVSDYRNERLPIPQRVHDLVSQMTLAEKIAQMKDVAPAIDRLGVPAYNWWNEALHGVARSGLATVFPQAIGLAATWNEALMLRTATVISDEARAKYHEDLRQGKHDRYGGLTFWSPNINLFRDPRWGRGQETYGEDPFLTGRMAVQFIRGLQGDDPTYLKTVATVKHFAVHSGPEPSRHMFDAVISERDLRESYLPQFQAGIREGGAFSLMCAYNRVDGKPACGSDMLLQQILRGEWRFPGYVVSDCGAIDDIYRGHKVVATAPEAAALGARTGTDLECGGVYGNLGKSVEQGLITEAQIDTSVTRLFTARFRLGMFDAPEHVRWAQIPFSVLDQASSRELARTVARESMVLLKNQGSLLPLRKDIGTLAVIGPNADVADVLLGNYNGTPSDPVTPLRGIREAVSRSTKVVYARGTNLADALLSRDSTSSEVLEADAERVARSADAVVLVLGLTNQLEGEEMRVQVPGFRGGDRTTLDLPASQERLLRRIVATGKPTVLVLTNGSALAINWAQEHVPAILEAWYPGQAGGTAIADVLFGDYNPAGRLPVTFYRSLDDLPPFDDYSMKGRTYRFFDGAPLYPFGHGLSYTTFAYDSLVTEGELIGRDEDVLVRVNVTNTGTRAGDEVVQLYVQHPASAVARPRQDLRGFARVPLQPGETRTVRFVIHQQSLTYWSEGAHSWMLETGRPIRLEVGSSSADIRATRIVRFRER